KIRRYISLILAFLIPIYLIAPDIKDDEEKINNRRANMAKYFTSIKLGLYLLLLIILQPIIFHILNLNQSKILSVIGHLMFILIGILLIYIHAQFNKNN
ncbi:hypothetical protein, partial [Staphylococcus warneri]